MFFIKLKRLPLAFEEIKSLCKTYEVEIIKHYDENGIVIIDKAFPFSRLVLSHYVAELNNYDDYLGQYRIEAKRDLELELPKFLKGKVNLSSPENIVRAEKVGDSVIFGKELWRFRKIKREYQMKSHVTMKAEFSRLLLNMAEVREGETVYDPFCGTGSILIEAGLMGMKVIGSDVSEKMVEAANINLRHLGIKADVFVCNAFESTVKADAVVSDLPYGRGSKIKNECDFEGKIIGMLTEMVNRKGHVVFVYNKRLNIDDVDGEIFESRVHRSLKRYIHKISVDKTAKKKI
ncbi:hypothetical protein DRN74_01930 [Candidatus Micrarchaeota archaeon]|nr:MAG: hypothetical protein DRN74_01930 [Candidatus Micrarchaeota archaeon]